MVRLRWTKDPLSDELYSNPIIAGKEKYIVFITLPKFRIIVMGGGKHLELDTDAKSLRAAKILAKKILIKLGARFYDEVRAPRRT